MVGEVRWARTGFGSILEIVRRRSDPPRDEGLEVAPSLPRDQPQRARIGRSDREPGRSDGESAWSPGEGGRALHSITKGNGDRPSVTAGSPATIAAARAMRIHRHLTIEKRRSWASGEASHAPR